MHDFLTKLRKASRLPPREFAARLGREARGQADRVALPLQRRFFGQPQLLKALGDTTLDGLWLRLSERPFPGVPSAAVAKAITQRFPDEWSATQAAAYAARRGQFTLFGAPLNLGFPFDWHRDHIGGFGWKPAYFKSIDYNNPGRASDVKVPWDISRLGWLVPVAQEHLVTGDDGAARFCRDVIEDWIKHNPVGQGVNWSCTMEAAMRIFSWTWIFHACKESHAWRDPEFRSKFLRALFLHGRFTLRHVEASPLNGNHFTADVAALAMLGHFFGHGREPRNWTEYGWHHLELEILRQTTSDGPDFEGSIAYHRLVTELFWWPARFLQVLGLAVPAPYVERIRAMGRFIAAYSRQDGSSPSVGDADDARAIPFLQGRIPDHRYLAAAVAATFNEPEALPVGGPQWESAWMLATSSPPDGRNTTGRQAVLFGEGGYAVLRTGRDHIFIDCGPVGFAGRGGHGHNDCLSFEAFLDGVLLVCDSGAYTYTRDYAARNEFRRTRSHATPEVEGVEINRMFGEDFLWTLGNDAHPLDCSVGSSGPILWFEGAHSGYERLESAVRVRRRIELLSDSVLVVQDRFEGRGGSHRICSRLPLSPGCDLTVRKQDAVIKMGNRAFTISWSTGWVATVEEGWFSPSYGVRARRPVLALTRSGALQPLSIEVRRRIPGGQNA